MDQIEKIYRIELQGSEESVKQVISLDKAFNKVRESKIALNKELMLSIASADVKAIDELNIKINLLDSELKTLSKQRAEAKKAADNQVKSEKELAAVQLTQAKTAKELSIANKQRTADMIAQEKELDRQIDREAKLAAAKEKAAKVAQAQPGSQQDRINQLTELRPFIKNTPTGSDLTTNFRGEILTLDQAIQKFKDLSFAEQTFRRQFQQDGTLVGEYSRGILDAFKVGGLDNLIKNQGDRIRNEITKLDSEFAQLQQQLSKVGVNADGSFSKLEKDLIDNRKAAIQLQGEMEQVNASLKGVGGIGEQVTTALKTGFKDAGRQATQLLASYVGFQAFLNGIQSGISITKELSDSTTNLEIELDKTAGGAKKIVDELSKLNTRTQLTGLEQIANIAAKAGVSEDRIVGVTAAVDKIKIAFGKDFGDVEQGTESLVKLVNVFEGTDQVTGETLLKVGNAVRTLANESVASVPFLNDFSKRMAGLKGISDISLPAVLGLASGFEQFGQSSEVAGTTLTKIIPKLATNISKYSEIAGVTSTAFSELIKNNPAEALIKVSEGLVKSKSGIEEISTAFADSNLGSGRIAAVLGTVGSKADDFRKAIASAGQAYNDTGNIEEAFAAKNTNLAATLDKITKSFADAANSTVFQGALAAISGLILILINNLPALVTILGLYAAGWALANKEMIIARAELIFQRTILPVLTLLFGGQANAMKAYAIATELAGKALKLLSTLMGNPIFRVFAATLGLSLIALKSFGASLSNVAGAFDKFAQKNKFLNEIVTTANQQINETKAKEEALLAIVKDRTLADETRAIALQNLKNIAGGYLDQLTLENSLTDKGTQLISAFNSQLERKAKLQAADAIAQRESNKLQQLFQFQLDIQTAIRTKGEVNTSQFSKDFLDAFYAQQGRSASKIGQFIGDKLGVDFTYSGKDLNLFASVVDTEIKKQLTRTTGSELAKTQVKNQSVSQLSKDLDNAKHVVDELTKKLSGIKEGTKEYADAAKALTDAQANVVRTRGELFQLLNKPLPGAVAATTNTGDNGSVTLDELRKQLITVNNEIAGLDKIKGKNDVQLTDLKNLRAQREEILRQIKEMGGSTTATNNDKGSRLSGGQKDAFKDIEAQRDIDTATVTKDKESNIIGEQTYLTRIFDINKTAIEAKLALLKDANAEERKLRAELQLDLLTKQNDLNQKLFDQNAKALEKQRQADIDAAKQRLEDNLAAAITETDKANAKQIYDEQLLQIDVEFNVKSIDLENNYSKQSIDNEKQRTNTILTERRQLKQDSITLLNAQLTDSQTILEKDLAAVRATYSDIKLGNATSTLPQFQKDKNAASLDKAEQRTILSTEIEGLQRDIPILKTQLDKGLNVQKDYNDKRAQLNDKLRELLALDNAETEKQLSLFDNLKSKLAEAISSASGFGKGSEGDQKVAGAVGDVIAQSYQLAQQALTDYFDAEKQRIEESRKLAYDRIELERQQRLAVAQSAGEKAAIEKKAAADKAAADKLAGERLKNAKRSEAKIAFATEIANIFSTAFQLGPIAGPIVGALLAGLAVARLGLTLNRINSEKFEYGGAPTAKGGQAKGKTHAQGGIPFNYEAEDKELFIVNKRSAESSRKMTVTGTPKQIASAINEAGGGVRFETGAIVRRFEFGGAITRYATGGAIGATLQAPVFVPASNNNSGDSPGAYDAISNLANAVAEQSRRIDRIQVVQVTDTVSRAQEKRVKQTSIGTL